MRFEALEDRRLLAAEADILFLVDKSASPGGEFAWIADLVTQIDGLDDYLKDPAQDIDPRYGLVGFGDGGDSRYGHSHQLDSSDSNSDGDFLFGNASQLAAVVSSLNFPGSDEDVWDGIEHAIQEYDFREGAAVIFVMFRRADTGSEDFGNHTVNDTLTREGILAAMESHNVTLNAIVEATFDPGMGEFVLGVEADGANDPLDGRQIAHVVNAVANQPTSPNFLEVSWNGSNSGTFVASNKSIRISTTASPEIAGPNTAGYAAESVTPTFEDISSTGTQEIDFNTQLTATDLGGFDFEFFGTTYTNLYINSNGTITFGGPSGEIHSTVFGFTDWDETFPVRPQIAALLTEIDALGFPDPFAMYWQVKEVGTANERLIVQWDDVNLAEDGTDGPTETVTFQAVLFANGDIRFNYQDLDVSNPQFTDGRQALVGIATDHFQFPEIVPAGVFIDRAHFINTFLNGSENDFVRLAWETGGAAWNNGAISGVPSTVAAYGAAFDTAFIQSIGDQILRKHATGDVTFADDPLFEINLGGTQQFGNFVTDTAFEQANNIDIFPNATTVVSTGANIAANGNSMSADSNTLSVFKSARKASQGESLLMDLPASVVPNGSYVVELMFAEIDNSGEGSSRLANVQMEGKEVLNHYIIHFDRAKIPATSSGSPEFEVIPTNLESNTPIVKRFVVEVTDGNGLQIELENSLAIDNPMLNGLRVLKKPSGDPLPTISDVIIKGTIHGTSTPWHESAVVSMKDRIESGKQFHSIATLGANTIEVHFSEQITIEDATGFKLKGHNNREITTSTPSLDATGTIVTLTFDDLIIDKYALHIGDGAVSDMAGNLLDGDWDNDDNGDLNPLDGIIDPTDNTPDLITDDVPTPFVVGNGLAGSFGGGFRLHFAYLPGDYSGDGIVDGHDFTLWESANSAADGDGDGTAGDSDTDLTLWQTYFGFYRKVIHEVLDFDFDGIEVNDPDDGNIWLTNSILADFNDDEIVDGKDLLIWQQHAYLALSGDTYSQGDTDLDGDADGRDFLRMLYRFNQKSAWFVPQSGMASGLTTGLPPQVVNVIISGSQSTHGAYSFDTVDGSGSQLATVPVGGADTISIVFSEAVNVSAQNLIVVGLTTANVPQLAEFSYDALTYTATWRFEGWALADNYLLYLSDSITDTEGNFLDGEWTNPASISTTNPLVSTFPSGDGISGGSFNFVMTLMPDVNQDNIVNYTDYYTAYYGELYGVIGDFSNGDFNENGVIDQEDVDLVAGLMWVNLQQIIVLADFDGDGDVDDSDLSVIRINYGMTGATKADGDLNGDTIVNELDIDLAFAQYGLWLDLVA